MDKTSLRKAAWYMFDSGEWTLVEYVKFCRKNKMPIA